MGNLFRQTIEQGCKLLDMGISNSVIDKFEIYYQMLINKNKEYNLTSIIEPVEAAVKHFIDSLTLYQEISSTSGAKIVDIGSGAGFPGIPLKIYKDDIDMTLIDAVGKKVSFMQQVIKNLNLQNVIAIQTRAEELASTGRERYNVALSRAVAELRVLVEYALPLIQVGGIFVAAKGPNVQGEIINADRAIKILGGEILNIRYVSLPLSNEGRSIVTIKKIEHTLAKYPRRIGIAKKRPL
ncbi:16S rRNA (guanine(527)-N(7))-methyltransferase RsmG [Desulfoscipio gibsoniae]|uniref:Ribosomal RNA small subunit methyltransferase G n=1 Tax=Desulfoscipio gibsoniae DSM 7213 TaxID=767817 RepID=R4KTP7_9FIRM|nr:16S rRNA (guanine(527)-N(7))-methyltransferase RsmG [Desulfoscipio gibsoniae]AGL03975.1 16S rRNA (guanine(527)-N(7))-methyltransferase GidB [Desulfoscipio gibsoniae DSM 7213]